MALANQTPLAMILPYLKITPSCLDEAMNKTQKKSELFLSPNRKSAQFKKKKKRKPGLLHIKQSITESRDMMATAV